MHCWFGIPLTKEQCALFGALERQTIIYELELLASILALDFWRLVQTLACKCADGARFSLIRGSCLNHTAARLKRLRITCVPG